MTRPPPLDPNLLHSVTVKQATPVTTSYKSNTAGIILMVRISVGDKTLNLYRGDFLWDNSSPVPSSFLAMGSRSSRRRSRGSRRASSYLPVVVLNSQQPYLESRSDTNNRKQVQTYKKSSNWPGKFSIQDLTFGLLGSPSSPDPMRSSSSLSGSYSGGGCSSGGNFDTLLFLAALAAAVFFLNQAITMNIGRKKRRFSQDSEVSFFQAGLWFFSIHPHIGLGLDHELTHAC